MKRISRVHLWLLIATVLGISITSCEESDSAFEESATIIDRDNGMNEQMSVAATPWLPALLSWQGLSVESMEAHESATITIKNLLENPADVELTLHCLATSEESASRPIGRVSLHPDETTEVNIDAEEIPFLTSDGIAQMYLRADVFQVGQPAYTTASKTVYYRQGSDPSTLAIFDTEFVEEQLEGIRSDALAHDEIVGDTAFEAAEIVGMGDHLEPEIIAQSTEHLGAVTEGTIGEAVPTVSYNIRFCTYWRTFLADTGYGEDYLNGTANTYVNYKARYARAKIKRKSGSFWSWVWSGYLDSEGCTPYVSYSASQKFYLYQGTTVSRSASPFAPYRIYILRDSNGWGTAWPTGTSADSYIQWVAKYYVAPSVIWPGNATKTLTNTTQNSQTNAAAVFGQIFTNVNNYGMSYLDRTSWLSFDLNKTNGRCGTSSGGGGYFGDGHICLNDEDNGGAGVWKHILAHEFGHRVADSANWVAAGDLGGYDPGDSPPALCDCDHMPGGAGHCLQSREKIGAAQGEGWAHFIATDAFNDKSDSDGYFLYYNPVRVALPSTIVYPPDTVVNALSNITWMQDNCPTWALGRGTEWDWLQFFYVLYAEPTLFNLLSIPDIHSVFSQASNRYWNTLNNKAADVLSAGKAARFSSLGDSRGVNH